MRLPDLDGIAVTHGPGLVGSLLVGLSVAKAFAYAHRLPLVGVNHLEGHIFAGRLADPTLELPFLALVVSGGHTALYACEVPLRYRLVGQTRDDAAGEAFDKVAKLLGLGLSGRPGRWSAPRGRGTRRPSRSRFAQFQDRAPDFSFSGLKTAVSLYVRQHAPLPPRAVADVCASFQATAVKMLVRKAIRAAREAGHPAHPAHRRRRGQRRPARGPRGRVRRARLPLDGAPAAALHGQRGDDRRRRQPRGSRRASGPTSRSTPTRPSRSRDAVTTGGPVSEVDRLLASLPDAVIGVRPDLTVFLWNGAAEALTGRSATRALERLLPECLGSEARLIRHLSETVRLAEGRAEPESEVTTTDGRCDPGERADGAHPRPERQAFAARSPSCAICRGSAPSRRRSGAASGSRRWGRWRSPSRTRSGIRSGRSGASPSCWGTSSGAPAHSGST